MHPHVGRGFGLGRRRVRFDQMLPTTLRLMPICARSLWKSWAPCTLCSFSDCTWISKVRFIGAPSAAALAAYSLAFLRS
jgi:hypothetical protein